MSRSIKKLSVLFPFLLQRYYAPLADKELVKHWKVYFQDESRFGLMTVLRRSITLAGVKPVGAYQHRFIYRYCYRLVEPLAADHFFVTAPGQYHVLSVYAPGV